MADSVARRAIRAFTTLWSTEWRASEADRHTLWNIGMLRDSLYRQRLGRAHCRPRWLMFGDSAYPIDISLAHAIPSGVPMLARCPDWFPPWLSFPGDEGIQRDQALHPSRRAGVHAARGALIDALRASVTERPTSEWRVGQLVRFLVDQADTAGATQAAAQCAAGDAWCARLQGFAHHAFGHDSLAYAAFVRGMQATSPSQRCGDGSLLMLLDDWQARDQLRGMRCAAFDSVVRRFWWLADPLWSKFGNARWVEHEARRVQVALHRGASPDERFQWETESGGTAAERLLLRYGWPSYVFWTGPDVEESFRQVRSRRDGVAVPKGYLVAAFEYRTGRLALTPTWGALRKPFETTLEDWRFSAPVSPVRYTSARDPDLAWWPFEHAPLPHPLMQLTTMQSAALPREHGVLRLVASDPAVTWEGGVLTSERDSLDARLLIGRGPDDVRAVAARRVPGGMRVVLEGFDPDSTAGLASLEVLPVNAGHRSEAPVRRARWGVPPVAPLDAAVRLAVSMPIVLGALSGGASLPSSRDSALALMLPSLDLGARPAVGVYWETYGLAVGDTVEIAVRIDRQEDQGVLGWLARQPKLRRVIVRWTEIVTDDGMHDSGGRGASRSTVGAPTMALVTPPSARALVPIHGWWRVVDLGEPAGERLAMGVSVRRLNAGRQTEAVGRAVGVRRSRADGGP